MPVAWTISRKYCGKTGIAYRAYFAKSYECFASIYFYLWRIVYCMFRTYDFVLYPWSASGFISIYLLRQHMFYVLFQCHLDFGGF